MIWDKNGNYWIVNIEFRKIRNYCICIVCNVCDDYYKKVLKNIFECNDLRKWWNMVNKIFNIQICNDLFFLEVNGNVVDNNFEKVIVFNIFFINQLNIDDLLVIFLNISNNNVFNYLYIEIIFFDDEVKNVFFLLDMFKVIGLDFINF